VPEGSKNCVRSLKKDKMCAPKLRGVNGMNIIFLNSYFLKDMAYNYLNLTNIDTDTDIVHMNIR
jgi:hypothetical protein